MSLIRVLLIVLLAPGCALTKLDSAGALALHDRAEALYKERDYTGALPLFQQLSREFPGEPEFHLRIGNSYAFSGNFDRAIAAYEAALAADPQFSRAWYNLAYVRAQQLADTLVRMHENLDPIDPDGLRLRKLVLEVLAPFGEAVMPRLEEPDTDVMETQQTPVPEAARRLDSRDANGIKEASSELLSEEARAEDIQP